ncbi:MAG TPA: DNA repair protein RecN [bacterium]|nr:DNA repair protein RecN [bacterium]
MLKELYIRNYALIEELRIAFGPGLNVLTGETGAGKSIIIGALSLLLGERAQRDVIRQGQSVALVEGIFDIPDPAGFPGYAYLFEAHGNEVLLRREIHDNGRSRSFVNDTPVPLATLTEIGDLLVDLHGQHDHQALLKTEKHLAYLDQFGVDPLLSARMKETYHRFKDTESRLRTLLEKEQTLVERRDMLTYRVREIGQFAPGREEEEMLEKEERILKNSERIHACFQALNELLYDGDGAALDSLSVAEARLDELREVDKPFAKWREICHASRIGIEELIRGFQSFVSEIEFDPERLNTIRDRLGQYALLKKKYGGSTEEVVRVWREAESELAQIGSLGTEIEKLRSHLVSETEILTTCALELSMARTKAAQALSRKISEILSELGLDGTVFMVDQRWVEQANSAVLIGERPVKIGEKGGERVEFMISTNPGEPPRPLQRVASGGEISRIMLALKTALAEADDIPVLIFDEIDTGVSGRMARIVGQNLRKLSETHQIVCITHLPQIASLGHLHYAVFKAVQDTDVRTLVRKLDEMERVSEIGKLLGGESVTETVLQNARELLGVDAIDAGTR